MTSYSEMRNYFFKQAKNYNRFGRISLILSIILTITSITIKTKDLIYLCSIAASFFLIIFWWLEYLSKKYKGKAVELHSLELIQFITEKRLINLEIAEYIPHKKKCLKYQQPSNESPYYSTPKEINIYQRNAYRLLENCYWNKFLYKKAYNYCFGILVSFICLFAYSFFIQQVWLEKEHLLLFIKILLVLLTSSLFVEFIYKIINLKNAYESMAEIYLRLINRAVLSDASFNIEFTKYSKCIQNAPDIPNLLHKIYAKKLNAGWDEVKKELKGSNTLIEIYNTLFIIKRLFEAKNKNIEWIVTGSASSVIRKESECCNDIDIIVDISHVHEIDEILKAFRIKQMSYSSLEDIRSFYGKYKIGGVLIDIMSNVENKVDKNWIAHPLLEKELRKFEDIEIYITSKDFENKVNEIIQSKHGQR